MDSIGVTPDAIQLALRRGMRDLVALSTLPALWVHADALRVADSLAEALLRILSVEFVYVRLPGKVDSAPLEVARTPRRAESDAGAREIGKALAGCFRTDSAAIAEVIPNPFGTGTVRLTVLPIGHEENCGWLAAGSEREDFPSETERLLLGVGVNQAAVVLQRKEAEQFLRQSEARYRALLEASSQLVWSWNPATQEGNYENVQRWWEELTDQPAHAQAGVGWLEVVHPEEREAVFSAWTHAMSTGGKFEVEYRILGRSGDYRHIISRTVPVRGEDGAVREWVGMIIDMTDQRRQEEALKEAARRKDEFLAMLAHELRNPLAPIRNGLQLMRLAGSDQATLGTALAMMERQVAQLVRLTDDLLDVARITRGNIELRKEWTPLAAIIGAAVEASRPLIEKEGHRLTVTLPPDPVSLEADPTRLAQAILNLLNNAAKYTNPGGEIRLSAAEAKSGVEIRIKDTGIGIPGPMLLRIFDMFTQVDRSLERAQGGLGIGLTLVKTLVELHGGSVEARSGGRGEGSEFVLRLPKAPQPTKRLPRNSGKAKSGAAIGGYRILVVDDHADSAQSMSLLFEAMGNDARTASDGLQAIEAAEAFHPHLIFLDIGMPRLNGYDAARRIRKAPWGKEIVLVALTGWGQEEDKRRSQEAGFNFHLVKPIEPAALKKLLAELGPARAV